MPGRDAIFRRERSSSSRSGRIAVGASTLRKTWSIFKPPGRECHRSILPQHERPGTKSKQPRGQAAEAEEQEARTKSKTPETSKMPERLESRWFPLLHLADSRGESCDSRIKTKTLQLINTKKTAKVGL